jgi:hypothetical protein
MTARRTVHELFPAFALELEELSRSAGRPDIATQIRALPVVARCTCGQRSCAHFYTAPPPEGAYGDDHSNILLPSKRGLVVIDLVGDRVVGVEVLDRPDVTPLLDAYLPRGPSKRAEA